MAQAGAPPFVSVIVPCRNEEPFIEACLCSILSSDFSRDRFEVLVVDGMSDDRTRSIVERIAAREPSVRLVDNPGRTAPAAMNVGIARARGSVIVRLDAHCRYPADYLRLCTEWLSSSGADNVGGLVRTLPANGTAKAAAIAAALSHRFGVGNAHFRVGTSEARWVDTVPFGCYRREVFDRIGLFDEDLVRNQDDEMNARLIRHGGRILLVPAIVSDYVARESLATLWRMYFQYGYFKPLAARRAGGFWTVRQLVPAAFVGGLALIAVVSVPVAAMRAVLAAALLMYGAADIAFSVRTAGRHGIQRVMWLALAFPTLHVSYGTGFLRGILDFSILRRQRAPHPVALAR
ncbi:MAG: glycosyltransferase family 2 protein [Vicinamibacterales bacterium]